MLIVCRSVKGGAGTSVVAAALASLSSRTSSTLLIDLAGDQPAIFGSVTPVAGRPLASPLISSDGRDLVVSFPAQPNVLSQTARPNLRQPTPGPIESFVPPLRPRAVAPPLGTCKSTPCNMAVSP